MQKLVSLDDIELNVSAADWQDAVVKSGTILVNNGYVTREYVDAMVQTVKTLGPYIVVAPGLPAQSAGAPDHCSHCQRLRAGIMS